MVSSPSPPPAPDPVKTAQAQGAMNKETAVAQSRLGMVDQYSPYGQATFTQIPGSTVDGVPRYRQDVQLSPEQQERFQIEQALSTDLAQLGQGQLGRIDAAVSDPFSYEGMPSAPNLAGLQSIAAEGTPGQFPQAVEGARAIAQEGTPGTLPSVDADARQQVQDALYERQTQYLDPQFEEERRRRETDLVNRGFTVGSEAYQRAMDDFDRRRRGAYSDARQQAITGGGAEQQRQFDMASQLFGLQSGEQSRRFGMQSDLFGLESQLQSQQAADQARRFGMQSELFGLGANQRDRAIQEELAARNQPINELAALMGSGQGVQVPQFAPTPQSGIASPDLQGLTSQQYAGQVNAANQQAQARNAAMGSLFGLGGSLGSAWIMSDRRLKTAIRRIGSLASGLPLYRFRYVWGGPEHIGVVAQDVLKVQPDAVRKIGGWLAVDYAKLEA